jgi:asparagine N-glycosylation enzyme membrane subunit Stt3
MAKTIATVMGVLFILVGLVGFISSGLAGFHLSLLHNLIHLVSGAVSLYFGLKGTLAGARTFCLAFGAVYGLLGVAGFLLGGGGQHTIAGISHGTDSRLLPVLPGQLELASVDHIFHIFLAIVFIAAGLLTRADGHRGRD